MSNDAFEKLCREADERQSAKIRGQKIEIGPPAQLLDDVHAFLGRFIIYPSKEAHDAHVLWIAHTHVMDAWESTPRLALLSPEPASGKTRALEVSELLVPNPVEAINVSPAYLFRKVGSGDVATILFDEIDTVFGPKAKENEDIRGLLNAGHRRGAVAGRCVAKAKTVETEEIPAYAAVALAGLGWLPDTLMSRSIVVRMRRRKSGERIEPFRRRVHAPIGETIRRRLAAWAATVLNQATAARPNMPKGVEDRDADMWESLLAIADIAGEHWPKRARDAAVALVAATADHEPSLGIRLLSDLQNVFGNAEQMTTATILEGLHGIKEAPWSDLKGKPLNDRGLAVRLRQYGVRSKDLNVGGDARRKGYTREDLHDAWETYLTPPPPPPDKSATSATNATKPDFQGSKAADVAGMERSVADSGDEKTADKTSKVADVADVALVAGYRGMLSDYDAVLEELATRKSASNGNGQPPLCDHCGTPGKLHPWDWPNRPDGIVLHSSCEGPWSDSEGARQ